MRTRFFLIILTVLLCVTTGLVVLHEYLVYGERLRLIDQQVRDTATSLLDSELGELRKVDFNTVESILADELGESRIGKFFVIRNEKGHVLFRSSSTRGMQIHEVPRDPQWVTFTRMGHYYRVLNLKLPRISDRTLQVGVVLDEDLVSPSYLSSSTLWFLGVSLSLGLVVAWVLTSVLLKPIRDLAGFADDAANLVSGSVDVPGLPAAFSARVKANSWFSSDEFTKLLRGLDALITRINKNYKVSRFWAYQMAHEIKTPLSIIGVEMEEAEIQGAIPAPLARSLRSELVRASDVVSSFLGWAEVENAQKNRLLHVNRVSRLLLDIGSRLESRFPGRLLIHVDRDFEVLANPQHVEQALLNLILNALKYSPEDKKVVVRAGENVVEITDSGPGVPQSVLDRIGEPFNRATGAVSASSKTPGNGLGLAWVASIAKLYDWEFRLVPLPEGTLARISFGAIDAGDAAGAGAPA